jgi:hypothetical protein
MLVLAMEFSRGTTQATACQKTSGDTPHATGGPPLRFATGTTGTVGRSGSRRQDANVRSLKTEQRRSGPRALTLGRPRSTTGMSNAEKPTSQ